MKTTAFAFEALDALKNNDVVEFTKLVTIDNANACTDDYSGYTMMHYACSLDFNSYDNVAFVEYLITLKADFNGHSIYKRTPLHYTLFGNGLLRCARKLLECGAYVNSRDGDNRTPIDLVVTQVAPEKQKPLVWLLLEHGAQVPSHRCSNWIARMDVGRKNARAATIIILVLQKYKMSGLFGVIGKDVTRCVAQKIWASRVNYQDWSTHLSK